ncbi:MAG TPA: hypothetical protein VGF48_08830 [Thermoanaerobaculia bacterium]|jgi:hypothetical protein
MTAIKFSFDIQVAGGPQMKFNDKLEVDAYDSIEVSLNGGETKTISVQPANADKVKLLFIRSSVPSDKVSFENKDAQDQVTLVNPLLLMGDAVALLVNAPKDLKFKNGLADPVTIQILAGRTAV